MKRAFLILSLAATAAFAQDAPAPNVPANPAIGAVSLPTIFDSNGKSLGNLVNTEGDDRVGVILFKLVGVDDGHVMLRVQRHRDGAIGWRVGPLYYQTLDCTGQAFALVPNGTLAQYVAVVDPDGIMHVGNADDRQWVATNSFIDPDYEEGGCTKGGVISMMVPLKSQTDLKTEFAPPFGVGGLPRVKAAKH